MGEAFLGAQKGEANAGTADGPVSSQSLPMTEALEDEESFSTKPISPRQITLTSHHLSLFSSALLIT